MTDATRAQTRVSPASRASEEVRVPDTGRASAYADLLQALIAARTDPATARFDAELAQAEADGRIDGPTARALRWWQRESLRALSDHLADVLPDVLDRLAAAEAQAYAAVRESEHSWQEATRPLPAMASGTHDIAAAPVASPAAPAAPAPEGPPRLRPVDPVDTLGGRGTAPAGDPPSGPRLLRPGFAPPPTGPEAHLPGPTGAPRGRLIAGGLTVAGDSAHGPGSATTRPDDPYGLAR